MNEARKYQRYTIIDNENTPEVMVDGVLVRLRDFSLGGMYILSKLPFTPGTINISINFKNRGKIDLIGNIVRVVKEGDMWGSGIDFSKTYNLNALKAV